MKYLEIVTKNGRVVRQNYFTNIDREYFVKRVNEFVNNENLLSFSYDEYEGGVVLEGFRAEWANGQKNDLMVKTIQLFSEDATVKLVEMK